jgi:hypothetical protein
LAFCSTTLAEAQKFLRTDPPFVPDPVTVASTWGLGSGQNINFLSSLGLTDAVHFVILNMLFDRKGEWPMSCSRVEEILQELLSSGFAPHLQHYVDRYREDPQFLFFHSNSTVLRLRVELELYCGVLGPCADCPINAVAKCEILDALTKAIHLRMEEQKGIAA